MDRKYLLAEPRIVNKVNQYKILKAFVPLLFLLFFPFEIQAVQVTLAWDAVSPTPDGYRLFQRTNSTSYDYTAPVWTGVGSDTTAVLENLDEGTDYYYVVRAYVGQDESVDSNEVAFTASSTSVEPEVYTIYATAESNGSISPSGGDFVDFGDSRTYTISPADSYHVSDVIVDGVSVGAVTSYTFDTVDANHTITARFAANTHTIYAAAEGNGTILPSGGDFVPYGTDRTYSIDPDAFHHVSDVVVDGASVGAVTSYTFTAIDANHTITARFASDVYTIQATAGANGSISPSGTTSVPFSEDRTYTVTANAGYQIADVLVDGASVGPLSAYTFSFVDDDHTISATFISAIITSTIHTISASAGAGGDISPSGQVTVADGGRIKFTVTARDGYQTEDVLVDGVSVGSVSRYTLRNVTTDHAIEARFSVLNQFNQPPDQPGVSLESGDLSSTSLTPTFETTEFSDPDNGDTHLATQWQIRDAETKKIVFDDTSENRYLGKIKVRRLLLNPETAYICMVRHYDSHNTPSDWSASLTFTTMSLGQDVNNNGTSDSEELVIQTDLNSDGVADSEQDDIIRSVSNPLTQNVSGLSIEKSITARSFVYAISVDPYSLSSEIESGNITDYGVLGYKIEMSDIGQATDVVLYFPDVIDPTVKWYQINNDYVLEDCSDDVVTKADGSMAYRTITDGGTGDADGVANGVIVDYLLPEYADEPGTGLNGPELQDDTTSLYAGSSDSGRCFINSIDIFFQ